MDHSPRSSKRRKLDTPKHSETSPLTEPSTRKTSGRLAKQSAAAPDDGNKPKAKEKPTPARRGRALKGATKGTAAKSTTITGGEIDVYDDIEGAFDMDMTSRSTRRPAQAAPKEDKPSTGDATDEKQPTIPPKRRKGRPTKAESLERSAVKNSAKRSKADTEDAESIQVMTPAKRATAAPSRNGTARKPAASRSNARKKKEPSPIPEEDEETDELQNPAKAAVPPRSPSAPKPAVSTRKKAVPKRSAEDDALVPTTASKRRKPASEKTVIPESEDELGDASPISNRKLPASASASARRRMNRTDNITNNDEERWSDAEGDVNGRDEDDLDIDGNSALDSFLDPTEPSPFNKPTAAQKEKLALPVVYSNLAPGRELDLLKTIVMERITAKRPSPLVGLDEEYKSVHQVVEHTITAGEGNSMLVIGARGSGKTALVNKVLSEVSKDNGGEYHVVRLNGFIHTDDKIALREIWRQLGKEMDIEEDGSGPGKNYADTLATLLALLSHPSEQTGEVTDQVAKAVIFVMDEFDLFAQHPRQTLLYNLFDIAQSRKAPIAVLGLTTRIDVTNSLEKRVKSRFSHRYVHLRLATTFTAFQEISKACLMLEPDQLSVEERGILEGGTKSTPTTTKGNKGNAKQDVPAEWNANISKLFANSSFLTQHLAPPFYLTKSIPQILTSFLLPTATLSPDTPFHPSTLLNAPDSKLSLIPSLSQLSLSLLIAAARLDIIHDSDTCNFNMAYDEYVTLASRARIQSAAGGLSSSSGASKVWGKDVARREWEGLVELGLCMPVIHGQVGAFGMVRCDVALEEVGEVLKGIKGGDKGLERWCRSI
ncbi:origin recognition complex subunit 4 [Stemphylium lycopersici]|nr:origin recognition complex subunit 4 [Stemphylium lycopersici]